MANDKVVPPKPGSSMKLEISNLPVSLWWKLMETARKEGVSVDYLLFRILVDALDYDDDKESYELLVKTIEEELGGEQA